MFASTAVISTAACPVTDVGDIAGGQAVQVAMGASGNYDQAVALLIDFDILFVVLTSLAARFVLDE